MVEHVRRTLKPTLLSKETSIYQGFYEESFPVKKPVGFDFQGTISDTLSGVKAPSGGRRRLDQAEADFISLTDVSRTATNDPLNFTLSWLKTAGFDSLALGGPIAKHTSNASTDNNSRFNNNLNLRLLHYLAQTVPLLALALPDSLESGGAKGHWFAAVLDAASDIAQGRRLTTWQESETLDHLNFSATSVATNPSVATETAFAMPMSEATRRKVQEAMKMNTFHTAKAEVREVKSALERRGMPPTSGSLIRSEQECRYEPDADPNDSCSVM